MKLTLDFMSYSVWSRSLRVMVIIFVQEADSTICQCQKFRDFKGEIHVFEFKILDSEGEKLKKK